MATLRVRALGATGAFGQSLVAMVAHHPRITLAEVVASERSVGTASRDSVNWRLESPLPELAAGLPVKDL